MFLTRLTLDVMNRRTMSVLSDIYSLHKALMSGFSDGPGEERILFRVEPEARDGKVKVLVQSGCQPELEVLGQIWGSIPVYAQRNFHPVFTRVAFIASG